MSTFRILSLDGGGIRGIITATMLQRLSADQRLRGWLDSADLIAGTSTGGLLALGLAHGVDLQRIRDLYETKGREIFDDSWLDDLVDLGQVAGAEYDNRKLERELRSIFGETTLAQLQKRVLITAFDLDNESADLKRRTWKPKLFHNFPGPDSDGAALAYKMGLYTSAAPTYFPSVDGYIDGGVFANNPSMCALTQTQDARIRNHPALSEIVLLSLGTGTPLVYVPGKRLDWGFAQWAQPLISLMLDGVSGIADYQCGKILNERYHRLAPVLPPSVSFPLDAVKRVPDMIQFAEGLDLSATIQWLRKHWMPDQAGTQPAAPRRSGAARRMAR
ncbi:MAG TPA: patatin-like phospholipase family protein [Anaerolineales bacterium]|nr:patatin-like phospholipase family protein [Anaerolineales bacterium]